jgi:hypothetical protein
VAPSDRAGSNLATAASAGTHAEARAEARAARAERAEATGKRDDVSAYTQVPQLLAAMSLETNDQATRDSLGSLIVRVSGEFDRIMGFSFDDDNEYPTVTLDGPGVERLYLPPPGAADVQLVLENDVALSPDLYERERRYGQSLLRLDANRKPTYWTDQLRGVVVTFTPNPPPPDLEEYCIRECVRSWQGRAAGYPDVVGVQGSNERQYTRAFFPGTVQGLQAIARIYGIRDMVAI